MATTNITKVRARLESINKLDLSEISFGVITEDGLEHKSVYEQVIGMLDSMKKQISDAYKNAEKESSNAAGSTAWDKLLALHNGDVASALAAMGFDTNFNPISKTGSVTSGKSVVDDEDSIPYESNSY